MKDTKTLQSEKLGTTSIPKLLLKMSSPAMLSMLVQSLYNIVDSIFVGKLGEKELTAVSLAFPLQMLVFACAIGFAIGTSSLIARRLGEGKINDASKAAQTGLLFALIGSSFFLVFGYGLSLGFLKLFTNDAEMLNLSLPYLSILVCCSVGIFIEIFSSRTMQAMGNMVFPMISQLIGAIINIILDPIMIFGLIGFPALGVMGAAIATVLGQLSSMTFMLISLAVKKFDLQIFFKKFKFDKNIAKDIFKVGLPTMFLNAISAFLLTILNAILITFSTTAVAVYGIYFKLNSFVLMPCFGLNQGAMPILGYNYGACNKKRFIKTLSIAMTVALILNIIGLILFCVIPDKLMLLFSATSDMIAIGTKALRIMSISFPAAAVSIILVAMYVSIGHGTKSFLITSLRQLIFVVPFALILGTYAGLNSLWYSFVIAEYLTAIIFIPITIYTIKKIFNKDSQKANISIDSNLIENNSTSTLPNFNADTISVMEIENNEPVMEIENADNKK